MSQSTTWLNMWSFTKPCGVDIPSESSRRSRFQDRRCLTCSRYTFRKPRVNRRARNLSERMWRRVPSRRAAASPTFTASRQPAVEERGRLRDRGGCMKSGGGAARSLEANHSWTEFLRRKYTRIPVRVRNAVAIKTLGYISRVRNIIL